MANREIDLSGAWRSRYEYGKGNVAEHIVDLRQHDLQVEGSSRLDESKSELFLHLLLRNDKVLEGSWDEITSPNGEYQGQRFKGVLSLLLNSEYDEAKGLWVGPNRDLTQEKSGSWILERLES